MALKEVIVGDKAVLVEVAELEAEGGSASESFEFTVSAQPIHL